MPLHPPRPSPSGGIVFGLYGSGGFGRGVMPAAREFLTAHGLLEKGGKLYFVEAAPTHKTVNGIDVIAEEDFLALPREKHFNIAIADSKLREKLATAACARGAIPLGFKANNTVIYDENDLGEGTVLCAYSTLTSNTKIGKFFHSNIYSYVEHDCVLGDYVTFAPRVGCNGHVHIGSHVYVGTGAVIKPGIAGRPRIIGEGAIIGMGAVVTKDVAPYTTVVGNPARPMEKQP